MNQFVLEYMLYLRSFMDEYPIAGVSPRNSSCCDAIYLENDSLPIYIQGPDSRPLSSTPLVALLQYLAERPFVRFTLPTFYQLLTTDTARRYLKVLHFAQEGRRSPVGIFALHRNEVYSLSSLMSTLREMNERQLIQRPKEGEKESAEACIEEFEPVFATIEPKK